MGSNHSRMMTPTLLGRNFSPVTYNQLVTAVPTSVWNDADRQYVGDLFSCDVVGWSIKPPMTPTIISDALTLA